MFKITIKTLLFSILVFFSACQSLDELNAPPDYGDDTSGLYNGDITLCRVTGVQAVSSYEIRLDFDNTSFLNELTNKDLYQVIQGDMVVQDVNVQGGYITLIVSNQIATQPVSLQIDQYQFQRLGSVTEESNETSVTLHSNYIDYTLLPAIHTLQTYGSDDKQDPTLTIMFPPDGQEYNLAVTGDKIVVRVLALDDYDSVTVEYRIDSQPYQTLGNTEFVLGQIPAQYYNNGNHVLFIRVTDAAGHSVVQSRAITLARQVPQIALSSPQYNRAYVAGGIVPIEGECADTTVVQGLVRIHNSLSNTGWLPMTGGPTNWTLDYSPIQEGDGSTLFEFITINAGNITNTTSNTVVLYDDRAIYVAESGVDNPEGGHLNAPLRTYSMAASIADSLAITNIYFSAGTFPGIYLRGSHNIKGGFADDFQSHDPDQYFTSISSIYGYMVHHTVISDLKTTSVNLQRPFKVMVTNLEISGNTSGFGISLNQGISNTVIDCYIHHGAYGVIFTSGSDDRLADSEIAYCGNANSWSSSGLGVRVFQQQGSGLALLLTNTRIHHNGVRSSSTGYMNVYGGGVYIYDASVNITDCDIYNNVIYLSGSACRGSSGRSKYAYGGGIYTHFSAPNNSYVFNLVDSSIFDNSVFSYQSHVTRVWYSYGYWGRGYYVNYCNSIASGLGGGLMFYYYRPGTLNITGTSITGNSANQGYPNVYPNGIYP